MLSSKVGISPLEGKNSIVLSISMDIIGLGDRSFISFFSEFYYN